MTQPTTPLGKLLREHYTDGVYATHVSLLHPKGKFQLSRHKMEDFWNLYCKNLDEDDPKIGIAEMPLHELPILVDVDLKINIDNAEYDGEHLYTEEQVSRVIEVYQSVLRNIIEGCNDEHLLCVLLEKPIYFIDAGDVRYAKNGFHCQFPCLFLSKTDQEVHLIPRVKDILKELDIFANLGIVDSGSVIDKSSCTAPWLLYGSRKSEEMDPYKVTKVIDSGGEEVEVEDAFKYYQLYNSDENLIPIRGKVMEYMPRILSTNIFGRGSYVTEVKHGLSCLC